MAGETMEWKKRCTESPTDLLRDMGFFLVLFN